jgi:diacylglycerol kinase (ATP)
MSEPTPPSGSPAVCVIFNPVAGKGRARERLEAAMLGWHVKAELWPTEGPGHAIELARQASSSGFEIVAAAGGDGTVHEVANGLLQAGRPEVVFAVLPLGSANDYAHSLDHRGRDRVQEERVDVCRVLTDHGVERHFVCCLGLGFGARVTIESQRLHGLQGQLLYGVAALRAMWRHWGHLSLTATLDGVARAVPTLTMSVMIGRREGGFIMAPEARLEDGWFDCVHAGPLTRWEALRLIPHLSSVGPPSGHPRIWLQRGRHLVIQSEQALVIHTDGEMLSLPEDDVRRIEIELMPLRLLVRLGLDPVEVEGREPEGR